MARPKISQITIRESVYNRCFHVFDGKKHIAGFFNKSHAEIFKNALHSIKYTPENKLQKS